MTVAQTPETPFGGKPIAAMTEREYALYLIKKHLVAMLKEGVEHGFDVWPGQSMFAEEHFLDAKGNECTPVKHHEYYLGKSGGHVYRDPVALVLDMIAEFRHEAFAIGAPRRIIWRILPELDQDEFTGCWKAYMRLGFVSSDVVRHRAPGL